MVNAAMLYATPALRTSALTSRYIALFHVGSGTAAGGSASANGGVQTTPFVCQIRPSTRSLRTKATTATATTATITPHTLPWQAQRRFSTTGLQTSLGLDNSPARKTPSTSLVCSSAPTRHGPPRFRVFSIEFPQGASARPYSSSPSSPSPASPDAASDASDHTTPEQPPPQQLPQALTWDRFLALRAVRRRYNLAASLVSAAGTGVAGVWILSVQDLDRMGGMLFGLDPVFALGALTLGFCALGWLLGPFAGNAAFGLVYRRFGPQITEKERQFYQRIKRNRADPSGQSVSNPVPDYYGEKISSVSGYRQWLKDQRAFRKKREAY